MSSCPRRTDFMRNGAPLLPLVFLTGLISATIMREKWPVKFADAAAKAGLAAANVSGDVVNKKYILEMNGSGVTRHLQYAPYLDYRPLHADEPHITTLIERPECACVGNPLDSAPFEHQVPEWILDPLGTSRDGLKMG